MTSLAITIRRTWCGKTRARLVGHQDGATIDVQVTGWRRASVLAEAQATFAAVSADPQERHPMLRALLLTAVLLLTAPTVAGAPGHQPFNATAPLDASQVVDTRAVYGELICRPGDTVPDDCTVDNHPTES